MGIVRESGRCSRTALDARRGPAADRIRFRPPATPRRRRPSDRSSARAIVRRGTDARPRRRRAPHSPSGAVRSDRRRRVVDAEVVADALGADPPTRIVAHRRNERGHRSLLARDLRDLRRRPPFCRRVLVERARARAGTSRAPARSRRARDTDRRASDTSLAVPPNGNAAREVRLGAARIAERQDATARAR